VSLTPINFHYKSLSRAAAAVDGDNDDDDDVKSSANRIKYSTLISRRLKVRDMRN
jgi:hypothetical protein